MVKLNVCRTKTIVVREVYMLTKIEIIGSPLPFVSQQKMSDCYYDSCVLSTLHFRFHSVRR